VVTLDRPKVNALSRQMQNDIGQVARDLSDDASVRAVVFYGGDRNFAAGADIKEMVEWDRDQAWQQAPGLHIDFDAVAAMPQPTIAAVTGYALGGGCELALCCDIRIAADNATFGQPEILLGIIPGAGGTQRLARLVGVSRAKELILTGRFVAADEALRIGLATEVVSATEVLPRAMELAQVLANGPRLAMTAAKQVIDAGADLDLAAALRAEQQAFARLFGTSDQTLGMRSFIDNGPGKAVFE
jgi:enoyl-CoA hydratase/carnithine racemase